MPFKYTYIDTVWKQNDMTRRLSVLPSAKGNTTEKENRKQDKTKDFLKIAF